MNKNQFVKFTIESYHEIEITLRQEVAVSVVVILKDDSTNQMFWKLSKVEELLLWRDGLVRATIVKVVNSDQKPRLMRFDEMKCHKLAFLSVGYTCSPDVKQPQGVWQKFCCYCCQLRNQLTRTRYSIHFRHDTRIDLNTWLTFIPCDHFKLIRFKWVVHTLVFQCNYVAIKRMNGKDWLYLFYDTRWSTSGHWQSRLVT